MLDYVKGDTKPDAEFYVEREAAPVDLSSAASITFKLFKPSGATVSRQCAKVGTGADGRVLLAWGAGDLNESGDMNGEVVVDWGGGNVEHGLAPIRVRVREEGQL